MVMQTKKQAISQDKRVLQYRLKYYYFIQLHLT